MKPQINYSPDLTMGEITKKLFNSNFLSDVQILVDDKVIQAHSFLLMMRSVVFQNQLEITLGEQKLIPINDVTYDNVYQFIKFVYTDECEIDKDNAMNLFKLAKRYKVIKLENLIIGFINGGELILSLFEYCLLENDEFQMRGSKNLLLELQHKCLDTEKFLKVHPLVIEEMLKYDCASVSEFKLFKALTRWIEQHAMDNQIEPSQQRNHYEKFIRLIRFPVMIPDEIYNCATNHIHLFTQSDCGALFKIIAKCADQHDMLWNDQPRGQFKIEDEWILFAKEKKFETKFTVGREMFLTGLEVGNARKYSNVKIKFSECNINREITDSFHVNCTPSGKWTTNVINLGESIRLRPSLQYTIAIEYCTSENQIACRKEWFNLFTNISTRESITIEESPRNLFALFFKPSRSTD